MFQLKFESKLNVSKEEIWTWITSPQGINSELGPWIQMSVPKNIGNTTEFQITPGQPLYGSYILLLGLLPIDRSEITLDELIPFVGFVEKSPMLTMKSWTHERKIIPKADHVVLEDKLTFQPRFFSGLTCLVVQKLFSHRHQVLRKKFA